MTTIDAPGPHTRITDPAALADVWRRLMGEGGFAWNSLWLLLLDAEDRMLPTLMPIDDIPRRPDAGTRQLGYVLSQITTLPEVASVALLLARPGPDRMTADDRAWARTLARHSKWPVHLATEGRVRAFERADLTVRRR